MNSLQISIPKSGTRVFALMTDSHLEIAKLRRHERNPIDQFKPSSEVLPEFDGLDPNGRYTAHLPYRKEYSTLLDKFDVVYLVLRDPRDIIISLAHYVKGTPTSAFNYSLGGRRLADLPYQSRVDHLIKVMRPVFQAFDPWRADPRIHVFYYEDYKRDPESTFARLSSLGFGPVEEIRERQTKRAYGFRVGTIENWKYDMTPDQVTRSIKEFGEYIHDWKS